MNEKSTKSELKHSNEVMLLYAGCNLAGCHTSLSYIGKQIDSTFNSLYYPLHGWRFVWKNDLLTYKLRVFTSNFRLLMLYNNVNDLLKIKKAESELELLRQMDSLIYVVDSQMCRLWYSQELLNRIKNCLIFLGRRLDKIPVVFQLNKRDLPEIENIETLKNLHSWPNCNYVESIATTGVGVIETLNLITQLKSLNT